MLNKHQLGGVVWSIKEYHKDFDKLKSELQKKGIDDTLVNANLSTVLAGRLVNELNHLIIDAEDVSYQAFTDSVYASQLYDNLRKKFGKDKSFKVMLAMLKNAGKQTPQTPPPE